MDSIPSLLGLALRAGRLAVGEEPVGVACRCHKGYLLLLASDAADNTIRRALHFCQAGKTICLTLPLTKQELGSGLGRASCAMLALTDVGFAAAVAEKLADGSDLRADELTASHADWAEAFAKNYTITKDNAMEIVQKETGLVFAKVLEHAGVYKRTPEGKEAFLRFIEQI